MHVFPQLRKLERKYKDELVVIGVHSAKFTSEKDTEGILQAILRYEIEHPVVNDKDFTIWNQYSVRAWPTLMFLDPQGKVVGQHAGEISFESFDQLIGEMVKQFDSKGLIDRTPLEFKLEQAKNESPLSFPGKVLADEASERLFIADSNHNRIIVASLDGSMQLVIGSGEAGLEDGTWENARFDHPQGMALADSILYVADTENHAIRKVDLSQGRVETIAGTGEQAQMFHAGEEGPSVELSSPWDLCIYSDTLFIAMAGLHQLWAMNLNTKDINPYAGNGREGIRDGHLPQAWLAQPSGITTDGEKLYFADSETSSIRVADLDPNGTVSTIVGLDLFVFGDVDGTGAEVRLQHPIGICHHDGVLFIADTYNNKIKRVFPSLQGAETLLGTGEPGYKDGGRKLALFNEPGGLNIAQGKLYIADTNNHAIRVADLTTQEVSTLGLKE